MKSFITILFLFLSINLFCQNTLYITLQPVDLGIGLRYDRQINNFGFYTSAAYGNFYGPQQTLYIKDHVRFVVGPLYYTEPFEVAQVSFGAGLVYSTFSEQSLPENFLPNALYNISWELCINSVIEKRWAVGIRYDFVKNESAVDIGIYFGKPRKSKYFCR